MRIWFEALTGTQHGEDAGGAALGLQGGDALRGSIVESTARGLLVLAVPLEWTPETEFQIRRAGGVVTYLLDGAPVHVSSRPSADPVVVATAVFASGDRVPGGRG